MSAEHGQRAILSFEAHTESRTDLVAAMETIFHGTAIYTDSDTQAVAAIELGSIEAHFAMDEIYCTPHVATFTYNKQNGQTNFTLERGICQAPIVVNRVNIGSRSRPGEGTVVIGGRIGEQQSLLTLYRDGRCEVDTVPPKGMQSQLHSA